MGRLLELIREISADADPSTPDVFDARWSYVAANLAVPLVTGLVIALVVSCFCRALDSRRGSVGPGDPDAEGAEGAEGSD